MMGFLQEAATLWLMLPSTHPVITSHATAAYNYHIASLLLRHIDYGS